MNIKKKYLKLSLIFIPGICAQYQTSLKFFTITRSWNTYKLSSNMARILIPITEEDEGDGDDCNDEKEVENSVPPPSTWPLPLQRFVDRSFGRPIQIFLCWRVPLSLNQRIFSHSWEFEDGVVVNSQEEIRNSKQPLLLLSHHLLPRYQLILSNSDCYPIRALPPPCKQARSKLEVGSRSCAMGVEHQ